MKKSMFLIFACAGFMMSCEKNTTPVNENPEVHFHEPTSGTMYNNGDTVHIDVHLTDDAELHEAFIGIYSATDTFFSYEPYVHDLESYELDTFWVVSGISGVTDAHVGGMAEDHDGGSITEEVDIHLMP